MKKIVLTLLLSTPLLLFSQPLWMRYPSISPDGQHIAFSYGGDIFVVSSSGGLARQITSHSAHDYMPVWTNSSDRIVFASNRYGNFDLFIVGRDGGVPTRLTCHSSNDYPYDVKPGDKEVVYLSSRLDHPEFFQFPVAGMGELYTVSLSGGREKQEMTICAEDVNYSADGKYMLFHNRKGYEDPWRKHHQSSVTRDIVVYDMQAKTFRQLTDWNGEDRNPVFGDNGTYYFLSEKSGTFNIWQGSINGAAYEKQITSQATHPVRFLSRANDNTLCFGYHGEIYTWKNGTVSKVNIQIAKDQVANDVRNVPVKSGFSEFAVSPNGKEVAVVYRGEIFAASIDFGTTRRITNTAEQERDISFSPDGKKIIFAGERNNSWNIYEVSRVNASEKYFYNATLLKEEALVETPEETFYPKYSPNGEEVAFLENRTTVRVINLKTKAIRTVLPGNLNYSYSDGDQYFAWSPDSRYLLSHYFEYERWKTDIGLIDVTGKEAPLNLTRSGYNCYNAKFAMNGEMIYYATDKYGYRSHGSWGSYGDVEAIFLTRDAYYRYTLSEEDYQAWKEMEKEKEKEKEKKEVPTGDTKEKKEKKPTDAGKDSVKVKPLKIEKDGLYDRKVRLTIHSSDLGDFAINNEGTVLYYLASFEKGYDLWRTRFKSRETKLLYKAGTGGTGMEFDKEQKNLYFFANDNLVKLDTGSAKTQTIGVNSEMQLNENAERRYMFEHAWRQAREKFYVKDLHGVDWEGLKKAYLPFLDHINNGFDFGEMLSELLGELNASHTGARYRPGGGEDQTGVLGCYYDEQYDGDGLRILEIMDKSPLTLHSEKITAGVIIEKVDGTPIRKGENYYPLFNRKAGKKVLFSFYNPKTNERWDELIMPISIGEQNELTYQRWIKRCEATVDKLSGGTVGYVHVRGMNSESFREVFDKALGRLNTRKALIVDTRFNGGGWLHDDLATFLSGKLYMTFEPRGQGNMGGEPIWKWQKASCVLMSEGNYSDAHMFPYTYKALGIGKLIGMPVPGTGTAVWWETMIDGKTVFGIPQVGMRSVAGNYLLENHELQPDIQVNNDYLNMMKGEDQQLIRAVEEMMK